MSTSIFKYNYEKYSAREIAEFVKKQGYQIEYYDSRDSGASNGYNILGMDIDIRLPYLEHLKEQFKRFKGKESWRISGPSICWQPFNKLSQERYYARESGDKQRIEEAEKKYDEYHEKASKIYYQLKRKFQLKKGEVPQSIKDIDWIKSLEKKWWKVF